jgi:hypothetical protein
MAFLSVSIIILLIVAVFFGLPKVLAFNLFDSFKGIYAALAVFIVIGAGCGVFLNIYEKQSNAAATPIVENNNNKEMNKVMDKLENNQFAEIDPAFIQQTKTVQISTSTVRLANPKQLYLYIYVKQNDKLKNEMNVTSFHTFLEVDELDISGLKPQLAITTIDDQLMVTAKDTNINIVKFDASAPFQLDNYFSNGTSVGQGAEILYIEAPSNVRIESDVTEIIYISE